MAQDVTEGHWYQGADSVCYPAISSCLTITCLGSGRLAGGHILREMTGAGGESCIQIFQHIQASIPANERRHVFVIGDTAAWNNVIEDKSGGGIRDLDEISEKLGLDRLTQTTVIDTHDVGLKYGTAPKGKLKGKLEVQSTGSVNVYVSPTGRVEIKDGAKLLHFKAL